MTVYCARCMSSNVDTARFCEDCGHQLDQPAAGTEQPGWEALVTVDAWYYGRRVSTEPLPTDAVERVIALTEDSATIGRQCSSASAGSAEVAVGVHDQAVSRAHAMLNRRRDGIWTVTDLGSTNGTFLNGAATAMTERVAAPIGDGDYVNVGAWTRITLRRTLR